MSIITNNIFSSLKRNQIVVLVLVHTDRLIVVLRKVKLPETYISNSGRTILKIKIPFIFYTLNTHHKPISTPPPDMKTSRQNWLVHYNRTKKYQIALGWALNECSSQN